jgi:hypothetical protein
MSVTARVTVLLGALAAIAGVAVLALGRSGVATIVGAALVGLAAVLLTGLAFLLVGESEDRDRLRRPRG